MTAVGSEPLFLTVEDVLELQAQQLELFGGSPGVRDSGALASAVATPSSTFDGRFLHDDTFAVSFVELTGPILVRDGLGGPLHQRLPYERRALVAQCGGCSCSFP